MLSFIVSAYNEVDNIEATVSTIQSAASDAGLQTYEIIIVDDGSTDGTDARVKLLQTRFPQVLSLRHRTNMGVGAAIRSGLAAARYPKFMGVPGDNDVHPSLVRLLLAFREQADLILTAPLNKEVRSVGRNTLSMLYQLIHFITFKIFVNYINGPGIWPTERARAIGLRSRRFSIVSEMNVKLLRSGCTFAEVPGYMQAGPKARRTVTLRNFVEVVRSFVVLTYEVHVGSRRLFSRQPRRVQIEFSGSRESH
jgi:glycosyltransferase involved in cell wall biosynthesis